MLYLDQMRVLSCFSRDTEVCLKKKQKNGEMAPEELAVSFEDLEAYGTEIVRYINAETDERALLILSGTATSYMFHNYSDIFEEMEDESGVRLKAGKTIEDLEETFRSYEAAEMLKAYMAKVAVEILYERVFGKKVQEN